MTRASAARFAILLGTAALLAAFFSSCAPRRISPPTFDRNQRRDRFERALAAREKSGVMVDADVSVWARWSGRRDLPGMQARLLLAAPDRFRLRVESLIGVAADFAGRGDSLVAYVPPKRVGVELDAERDSLGIAAPGELAFRAWSAAWRPPAGAWAAATWGDSLLVLRWPENRDTIHVAVGASGLPARVTLRDPRRGEVTVRYAAWTYVEGVPWPTAIEYGDAATELEITCRITRVRFAARPDEQRLTLRVPTDASRLTRAELRRLLDRLGAF